MAESSNALDQLTIPGELYERLPDGALRWYACAHRCLIKPGRRGIYLNYFLGILGKAL